MGRISMKQQLKDVLRMEYEKGRYDMREQLMMNAVEGTVEESDPCQWQILSDDLEGEFVVKNGLIDGDRVKLIIIKED